MSDVSVPPWHNKVCPIMSHALIEKTPAKPAAPTQMILPGMPTTSGGAVVAAESVAVAEDSREYVGCLGPACAFFVEAEGACAVNLIPRALGAMFSLQASQVAAAVVPHNGATDH